MGENIVRLGLFTLRDFDSSFSINQLKASDHLFCITFSDELGEYEIKLIWKRKNRIFIRDLHPKVDIPQDQKSLTQIARLQTAAAKILNDEKVNLLNI